MHRARLTKCWWGPFREGETPSGYGNPGKSPGENGYRPLRTGKISTEAARDREGIICGGNTMSQSKGVGKPEGMMGCRQ